MELLANRVLTFNEGAEQWKIQFTVVRNIGRKNIWMHIVAAYVVSALYCDKTLG